jgi:hypothetical protein
MFICPDCEKTRMEYARGSMRSTGQCEICDKVDNCLDARDYKEKPRYLIWSNEHRAWWRPGRAGYTTKLEAAGRYSREEALRTCALGRDGWGSMETPSEIPVSEADAFACQKAYASAVAALS